MDRQIDGQIDRQIDRQKDRQIDRQKDRQIDTHTAMYMDICRQGCSSLVYCYIVDPGPYLENKENH